jgi:hypothetical protein
MFQLSSSSASSSWSRSLCVVRSICVLRLMLPSFRSLMQPSVHLERSPSKYLADRPFKLASMLVVDPGGWDTSRSESSRVLVFVDPPSSKPRALCLFRSSVYMCLVVKRWYKYVDAESGASFSSQVLRRRSQVQPQSVLTQFVRDEVTVFVVITRTFAMVLVHSVGD